MTENARGYIIDDCDVSLFLLFAEDHIFYFLSSPWGIVAFLRDTRAFLLTYFDLKDIEFRFARPPM